jgi:hypothetical protein
MDAITEDILRDMDEKQRKYGQVLQIADEPGDVEEEEKDPEIEAKPKTATK